MMPDQSNAEGATLPSVRSWMQAAVPTIVYCVFAMLALGAIAHIAAVTMILEDSNRDIWQHVAAVRALMENLGNPSNPFVVSTESSRHFHPLWVVVAAIGKATGSSPWDVMFFVPYAAMLVLAIGVFSFARAYFMWQWAPLILLGVMLFGWGLQVEHTGFHNALTLVYAAAYPATFMIGLGLMLWAMTIRSLENHRRAYFLVPLVALMFTLHQLGAVIALITAGCFVLLWPDASVKSRVHVSLAVVVGLGLSLLWPYHNPLELVLQSTNPTWEDGPDFYAPLYIAAVFSPAILGFSGFRGPRSRPVVLALVIYFALFLAGFTGLMIAGRFMMPMVLLLHIGLVGLAMNSLRNGQASQTRKMATGAGVAASLALLFAASLWIGHLTPLFRSAQEVTARDAAMALTADIPDDEPVAAYGMTAWPIVASGQKVVSVPLPEPGILDLAERQAAIKVLFETPLSTDELIDKARGLGTRTLITDTRLLPQERLAELQAHGFRSESSGTLVRIDLPTTAP